MRVVRFATLDDLAPWASAWDRLAAGQPLRGWPWQHTWWRHYGLDRAGRELYVVGVFDDEELVAVAPWYRQRSLLRGRVLRLVGTGEVCSDYLGVLCNPACRTAAVAALADWLTSQNGRGRAEHGWDLLELTSFDAEDRPTRELIAAMALRRHLVDQRPGPNCWRLTLPDTWEAYLAMLSKSRRKQVRRVQHRLLESERAVLHTVSSPSELARAEDILVELHRKRRKMLGDAGRFASEAFAAFHREVAALLLDRGQLRLHWLELDGRPVAAEYHLAGGGVIYAYQAGVEPEALDEEPGSLITVALLQRAIAEHYAAVDFLRGDEPYKAIWRAQPRLGLQVLIAANAAVPRCRLRGWMAARRLRDLVTGRKIRHFPDIATTSATAALAGRGPERENRS